MTGTEYRDFVSGQRKLVKKQLWRKFGSLTDWQMDEVTFMKPEKLEELALALIDAKSLEELGLKDPPADAGE